MSTRKLSISMPKGLAFVIGCTLSLIPAFAVAQSADQMSLEAQQLGRMIEMLVNLIFLLVFGAILLIARRDMTGWDQPLKDVWFSFQGRLNRKAYWLKGMLPMWMIGSALQLLGGLIGSILGGSQAGAAIGSIGMLLVLIPYLVLSIWVGLALTVKRFHDLGQSGWWILGGFIPFFNIWLGIKLAFFRGSIGPNSFGADPIDPVNAYIKETFGDDEPDGGSDEAGSEPLHPHPRPPEPDSTPKGFGAGKFIKPKARKADPIEENPSEEPAPTADLPGGEANIELIKNRLGADIMRPIPPTKGGADDT